MISKVSDSAFAPNRPDSFIKTKYLLPGGMSAGTIKSEMVNCAGTVSVGFINN